MRESLTLSQPNRFSALPRLTEAVIALLRSHGLSCEVIDTVHLALDELVANVIRWGHDDGREHQVQVTAAVDAARVQLVIEDDGRPFDPSSAPPPDVLCPPEDRREGGLGIHLVRTMVDEVRYERVGGRNIVTVSVARDPVRSCPPASV
jgi:serine/threonine-protein kinase RsbW